MRTVKNYVGIILCACVIIFIYKTFDISLFSNILSAFIPLIVGAILAYFLQPLVYKFEVNEVEGKPEFFLQVSTGSIDNIKPEFVLESIYSKIGEEYNPNAIQIHRNEVYSRNEETGELISLLAMGEEIR